MAVRCWLFIVGLLGSISVHTAGRPNIQTIKSFSTMLLIQSDLCLRYSSYWWGVRLLAQGCLREDLPSLPSHRPPTYFRSIFISHQYYVWVCGIFAGFHRTNFASSISEQREWLRTMKLRLCASLSCIQTLAIGYGRSKVALGCSNNFKLQQTPAFQVS